MKRSLILVLLTIVAAAVFAVAAYIDSKPISQEVLRDQIENNLNNAVSKISAQAEEILEASERGQRNLGEYDAYYFYWIKGDTIVEWSTNHFLPPISATQDSLTHRFFRAGSGDYILVKWSFKPKEYLVGALPLSIHYKITNQYLKASLNRDLFGRSDVVIYDPLNDDGYPILMDGQSVFRVAIGVTGNSEVEWYSIKISALLIFVLLFGLSTYKLVSSLALRSASLGFLVLFMCLVFIRIVLLVVSQFGIFDNLSLFDPQNFASSDLNPSLGDMVLNATVILFLCIYLFTNYTNFSFVRKPLRNRPLAWGVSIISSVLVFFGVLFTFVVIQTLYNNSSLNISITQSLTFDVLRVTAFLVVVISWLCSWLFVHVFIRLITIGHDIRRFTISVFAGVIIFAGINELTGQVYFPSLIIGLIYLLIVLLFGLHKSISKFQYASFVYFFVGVVCFSVISFFASSHFERLESTRNQIRFASNFLIDRDYFGEYLLAEALGKIKADIFIQSRMASPLLGKEPARQKIRQYFLPAYFNKYNIEVQLFNVAGDPIDNSSNTKLASLIAQYDRETSQTGYVGVYYVAGIQGEFSQQYLAVSSLYRNNALVGYAVIKLSLKRIIPVNVYPELLIDNRFQKLYKTQELSYAVLHSGKIQFTSGEFNYDQFPVSEFSNSQLYTNGLEVDGYLHVAVEDAVGKTVIVSSAVPEYFFQLANVSFFILLGVGVVLVYLFVQGISTYFRVRSLLLAARIQLFLNMAFFIPLIAVSIITLTLTSLSSQEQLNEDYLTKARSFASQLSNYGWGADIEGNFSELVKLSNADANLFTSEGRLLTTSQAMIFENQLLAPVIKPEALDRIKQGDKNFVLSESVGMLNYFVAYSALNSVDTGELLGVVALPFFQSGASLEKIQIAVLANILVIFTLLFVVLLFTSFFVSKWLTFPLQLITKTLGKTSLLKSNQPLVWESNDEIGLMVREYNQMLDKLGESKIELERTQRERAWREIAQQVAHEIKNPLTPMKLTLQQMERSISKGEENQEKIGRSVNSLLAQVNTLDGIASSFSAFAKMPEPVMTNVDLVELISGIHHFHAQSGVVFSTKVSEAPVLVDEQLLSRIISNIVLNGIQSVVEGTPKIDMQLEEIDGYYRVSIRDNGSGIDESLHDKIFLPHFTTKQSGSGLGLAIARQGIEQMSGRISFSTSPQGTTFIIELPDRNNL